MNAHNRRRRSIALLYCSLLALGGCSGQPSSSNTGEHVSLSVDGMEKQLYLPVKLTERLGYFKDEGLDVELINSRSGAQAANDLLAGSVQGTVGFYDHTIDLQTKGKSVEAIVLFTLSPGEVELVRADVPATAQSLAGLKGQAFGVTGLGSSTEFLTRFLASRAGLQRSEYSVLPVGAADTFSAALLHKQIAAGMTTEPTASRLLEGHQAKILVDLRTPESTRAVLGGRYPAAALYVQSGWLGRNHDTAQKLANAFIRTLHWIAHHSAAEIADQLPPDYYAGDKGLYVRALQNQVTMFSPDGVMPADGAPTVLAVLRTGDPAMSAKTVDLSKTYTNDYVTAARAAIR